MRSVINKKKRTGILVFFGGFAIIIADFIRTAAYDSVPVVAFLGFGVSMVGMLYSLFWVICPSCKGTLGHMAMYSGGPFSISKKFRFCPYCGVDLDSEVGASRGITGPGGVRPE